MNNVTWRYGLRGGLLLVISLLLSGCMSRMLATRLVSAPNRQGLVLNDPKMIAAADAIFAHAWRTTVGPPAAELAVAVVDPADYEFIYEIKSHRDDNGGQFDFKCSWNPMDTDGKLKRSAEPPKATLVLLHGFMMRKEAMVPWAVYFAQHGFRVVLVDGRGHGRSTGRWVGYGAWEADDLGKVADELERRGLLVGKLGVFGESYGASMALHWAARDPRVATVVALAPFADARTAIPQFARGFNPRLAARLSDATYANAFRRAEKLAGFTWSELNVTDAVTRIRVPVFFFHGGYDSWIPPLHSETLEELAPKGSRREITPDDEHTTLMMRYDIVGPQALTWFDQWLATPES